MKKLIIVDDEKTIRTGLSTFISKTGKYEIVSLCKNGKEALEAVETFRPDIVLTDIRMPTMDGFSFIERCSKLKHIPKFIILSGYGEFEYAKNALQLKVFDYLLKPIDCEYLISLLEKVSKIIDAEKMENGLLRTQIGLLGIQNSASQSDMINALLAKAGLSITIPQVMVISFKTSSHIITEKSEKIRDSIDRIFDAKFSNNYIIFEYNQQIVIILNESRISRKSIPSYCYDIGKLLKNSFQIDSFLGIGEMCTDTKDISISYNQALSALSYAIYEENNDIYFFSPERNIMSNIEIFYSEEKNLLVAAINTMDRENAFNTIENFFIKASTQKLPPAAALSFAHDIIQHIADVIFSYNFVNLPEELDIKHLESRLSGYITLNELKEMLNSFLDKAFNCIETAKLKQYGYTIDNVIKYIHSHYNDEDIDLNKICNHFHINISYFCKIFKEKTGNTFLEYLTALRIEYAKKMLQHGNFKIYEIAKLVGFSNPKYFAKVFKEITNATPVEYKNKFSIN